MSTPMTTVAEISQYFILDNSFKGIWEVLSIDVKEAYRDRAEEELSMLYYKGEPKSGERPFPRTFIGVVDPLNQSYLIANEGKIPKEIKNAVSEQIKFDYLQSQFSIEEFLASKFDATLIQNFDIEIEPVGNNYYNAKALKWIRKVRRFPKFK